MRILFINLFILFLPVLALSQIYIAQNGSDDNDGTKNHPFQSFNMALRKAREMRRLNDPMIKNGIEIIVGDGGYKLSEPILIRPEDAGTSESPTIIRAEEGAHPVLQSGFAIGGWKKASASTPGLQKSSIGKVWVTTVPVGEVSTFRELWVDGRKVIRARERNGDSMSRILSWDKKSQTCWIPKPKGIDLSNVDGAEMFIHQWWAIAILRIKSMKVQGDSLQLTFHQPESRIQSEHPWPAPWISKKTGNSAFYLSNALQFLDEPDEWFFDEHNRKLYYYPGAGAFLGKANVHVPALETLVKIQGTIDHPVSHVYFKGISFQYTNWTRPSTSGHVPLQAGMYLLDAYKLKVPGTPDKKGLENQAWIGRPPAAVEVTYANHTGFENCRFEHLSSTGLDYIKGTSNDSIVGNVFKDIGGSGILVGTFSDASFETHRPYQPSEDREVCTNEYIGNNLITDVTNEDWGCVGIGAGYVRGINIEHNEVRNVSYTGISVGWGWTKTENVMKNNRVFANKVTHYAKHMYDVAGIYTLSAQPGTMISNNYIDSIYKAPYAHDPNHWFYLYTDEGSSGITVRDNWCPEQKFLQNANGPGNSWENNGPLVDDEILKGAGIEPRFRVLLMEKTNDQTWPINRYFSGDGKDNPYSVINNPVVIEIVLNDEKSSSTLLNILHSQIFPRSASIYRWQHHFALFGKVGDTAKLKNRILSQLPSAALKIYDAPFYSFDRRQCGDTDVANDWEHTVLTANLVKDANLQNEYLDYHAHQYEKWPEVSLGFCKADFQQLLVYKNGRQLMLVISTPKGSSLEELNPKTTENNPRVNDWNNLMKKYQEGIEGAKPGETWVILKPVIEQK